MRFMQTLNDNISEHPMIKLAIKSALLLGCVSVLSGCATATIGAITETGITMAEERTAGQKVDDLTIYTAINKRFLEKDSNDVLPHVTVNVRYGRVLLTGNVNKPESAELAVKLAWQVDNVKEVINEISVRPETDLFDNANDALIKTNLETRLLFTKDTRVIDYSIDVVSNVAYLLGEVRSEAELDSVLRVARTTKGVQKVISHLKVRPPDAAITPQAPEPKPIEDWNEGGLSPDGSEADAIGAEQSPPDSSFDDHSHAAPEHQENYNVPDNIRNPN